MHLQDNDAENRPNMGEDFIKKIGLVGAIFILVFSALGIFLAFTIDLSTPNRYESLHDAAYYSQNADTMEELLAELREFVFPNHESITDSYLSPDGSVIIISIDSPDLSRTRSAIVRDFDESLFRFIPHP